MDRASDLDRSLPSLLNQTYDNYRVYICDQSSRDDVESRVREANSGRLIWLRTPRPRYFSFSRARNTGLRYSESDLVLFLNADNGFVTETRLEEVVSLFIQGRNSSAWFAEWHDHLAPPHLVSPTPPRIETRFPRVYCQVLGCSMCLLDRAVIQQLGGFNENMQDWGYEDDDLYARLELTGFLRIPMEGISEPARAGPERVTNLKLKDTQTSWQINRLKSDYLIRAFGPALPVPKLPGLVDWIDVDGMRLSGASAPQQHWRMPGGISELTAAKLISALARVRAVGRDERITTIRLLRQCYSRIRTFHN